MHGDAHHSAGHSVEFDSDAAVQRAADDAEVLLGLSAQAADMLAEVCHEAGTEVRRVIDLGCGPGVGTCCLAERLPSATIVAVDGSAAMLEHARERVGRAGYAGRVELGVADLPSAIGQLGPADVVWASLVIHHLGDETAALRQIRTLLQPSGLLALLEVGAPLRVHTGDRNLGRPGIWERLDAAWAAWFAQMRSELPDARPSEPYDVMLAAAGYELVSQQDLRLELAAPLEAHARQYAHDHLTRAREQLQPHADPGDIAAIEQLLDERADSSVMRRPDVALRAERRLYLARPASDE